MLFLPTVLLLSPLLGGRSPPSRYSDSSSSTGLFGMWGITADADWMPCAKVVQKLM